MSACVCLLVCLPSTDSQTESLLLIAILCCSVAHIASSLGYLDCLDLIHSHIGHIDLKNDRGARPLHEAAGNGHIGNFNFICLACH